MARVQVVEAVVTSTKNFGEADRLLTLFTKQYGKLKVLAKGVRRIKSRRGGNLDLLNYVTAKIVFGRSIPLVTEAETMNAFQPLKENLGQATTGYYVVELVNELTVEEAVHIDIFYLLTQTLSLLSKHPRQILIHAFEIKLLRALGFWDPRIAGNQDENVVAAIRAIEVQSLTVLAEMSFDNEAVKKIGLVTQMRLENVAEKEFNSPKIKIKLQEYLKRW